MVKELLQQSINTLLQQKVFEMLLKKQYKNIISKIKEPKVKGIIMLHDSE